MSVSQVHPQLLSHYLRLVFIFSFPFEGTGGILTREAPGVPGIGG